MIGWEAMPSYPMIEYRLNIVSTDNIYSSSDIVHDKADSIDEKIIAHLSGDL